MLSNEAGYSVRKAAATRFFSDASWLSVYAFSLNISLPDALKNFVDEQVSQRGYGTSSEYVRELIRKDRDLQQLRGLLLAGASSLPAGPADAACFTGLRDRVRGRAHGSIRQST